MLHGPQREEVDLSFSLPSVCAREVEEDTIQIGLVPVAEVARQDLEIVPGVGITCLGAVRSILMFSRLPWRQVKTLAADLGSRTSVQLARIILRERFGVEPEIIEMQPLLDEMLLTTDAALIIGDPALQIDPNRTGMEWLDLGAEWYSLTQLPMVFAAWAGKPGIRAEELSAIACASYRFGKARMAEIVDQEYRKRHVTRALADRYLHEYIRFEIGVPEERGLSAFWELAGLKQSGVAQHA